ncbi:hypothetical protein Mapa_014343 [Marchantia paleacea]|nr:hypothetical protein Mapa_014343 [Marchantia paleacea]
MALCSSSFFTSVELSLPCQNGAKKSANVCALSEMRACSGIIDSRQVLRPCSTNASVASTLGKRSVFLGKKLEGDELREDGYSRLFGFSQERLLTGFKLHVHRLRSEWKLRSQVSREDYHVSRDNDQGQHQSHKEALKEAIFELEYMVREPAEVLEGLQERLSTRDLELVLAYFAQEGRDSWCALEVFEWMQRVNRVGDDTHKLMMRIMFDWIMKLVEKEQPVEDVKSLLQDMHCVGLKPEFHIMQSIIGTYWEKGMKAEALCFVKEMLDSEVETEGEDPVVFLILKMVKAGEQREALELIRHLRCCGFKLKVSAYTSGLVAAVVEQEQLTTTQRQIRDYERRGVIFKLDHKDWEQLEMYENNLHGEAEQMAKWAVDEEIPEALPSVHERLLAMYCIAGKALEAEKALWGMKLAGKEPPMEMYNTILGICGYRNQTEAVVRILRRMEVSGKLPVKKTYSVLMGGYIKGGHCDSAAEIMHLMLEKNIHPDPNVMLAVLRALQKAELVGSYLKLCKRLAEAGLIEPVILYFYVDPYNLCIIRPL